MNRYHRGQNASQVVAKPNENSLKIKFRLNSNEPSMIIELLHSHIDSTRIVGQYGAKPNDLKSDSLRTILLNSFQHYWSNY